MVALLRRGLHRQGQADRPMRLTWATAGLFVALALYHRRMAAKGSGQRLWRHVRRRCLCPVRQGGDPGLSAAGGAGHERRTTWRGGSWRGSNTRSWWHAVGCGHDGHGLGGRPDGAVPGAGAAIAGALRHGVDAAGQRQIDGSGPEILRSGRAVLGSAALWCLAGLRLCGHHAV